MSVKKLGIILIVLCLYSCKNTNRQIESVITSKNPIVDGWYADPDGIVFGNKYVPTVYFICPTCACIKARFYVRIE